jgi:hypothetical protein
MKSVIVTFRQYVVPLTIVLSFIAIVDPLYSVGQEHPSLNGFITDPGSPTSFIVDGINITCTADTVYTMSTGNKSAADGVGSNRSGALGSVSVRGCPRHFLGESIAIVGERDKKEGTLTAIRIDQHNFAGSNIVGFAVVEGMLSKNPASQPLGELVVRADGYRVVIAKATNASFNPPMRNLEDVQTNAWIRYSGRLQEDGTILADEATFWRNDITKREQKLRDKDEFDPSATQERDRQRHISRALHGLDAHRIPAYRNDAMQQRVDALGSRLIPTFQRKLPDSDPTKIRFRFQLVDQKNLRDGLALPSGIILVPFQVVSRLQNDTQLATVLADDIATAIEKEGLRELPAKERMQALRIAGTAGGFFVPGLGLVTGFVNHEAKERIDMYAEAQSGRVSLDLLHDAGFDITQAPVTWWLLASTKPRDLKNIKMPFRARALYGALGTTWRLELAPLS